MLRSCPLDVNYAARKQTGSGAVTLDLQYTAVWNIPLIAQEIEPRPEITQFLRRSAVECQGNTKFRSSYTEDSVENTFP